MEAVRLVAATRGNAKTLYLHAGGKLSFDPPAAGENSYDEYVSDAAVPVPFVPYATTEPISKYMFGKRDDPASGFPMGTVNRQSQIPLPTLRRPHTL